MGASTFHLPVKRFFNAIDKDAEQFAFSFLWRPAVPAAFFAPPLALLSQTRSYQHCLGDSLNARIAPLEPQLERNTARTSTANRGRHVLIRARYWSPYGLLTTPTAQF